MRATVDVTPKALQRLQGLARVFTVAETAAARTSTWQSFNLTGGLKDLKLAHHRSIVSSVGRQASQTYLRKLPLLLCTGLSHCITTPH